MDRDNPVSGDALYVPASERAMAMSVGATLVEGDARLFVPSVLPDGVTLSTFSRWRTDRAKFLWLGEFIESVVGEPVDLLNIAGFMADGGEESGSDIVPLFVPTSEMNTARRIPGVWWDRNRRMYVADKSADFGLIHRYLTPAMRSAWMADRNMETAMNALVRAQAMIFDDAGGQVEPREMHRPEGKMPGHEA